MLKNILRKHRKQGFSMVEIVVVIGIMVVIFIMAAPSLVTYVERTRMQKDETMMSELVNAVNLALARENVFDEAYQYSIDNNYITYTDSSGSYGSMVNDGEYWAADGYGRAMTITFNPENGKYVLSHGIVNDMTWGNGTYADERVAENLKTDDFQCNWNECGEDSVFYHYVLLAVGENQKLSSRTFRYSSFTLFVLFNTMTDTVVSKCYGYFNGTNISSESLSSLGSGTTSYSDGVAIASRSGGTTTVQINTTAMSAGSSGGGGGSTPAYKKKDYTVTPVTATYKKPSSSGYAVQIADTTSAINKVYLSGTELTSAQYTKSGSGTITLVVSNTYLNALADGTYKLYVQFADGEATYDIKIES